MFDLTLKTGATFRLINPTSGEMSPGYGNLILNSATPHMRDGFAEEPTPKLGSSIVDVVETQNGVQAVLANLVCTKHRQVRDPSFTRTSAHAAALSWEVEYTFKNTGTSIASISEVGFGTLNRAVFKDDSGIVRAWNVAPNEEVLVVMEFVISMAVPTAATTVNIQNNNGEIVDTIDVSLAILNKASTLTPQWWKLLSKPSAELGFVVDSNFNGVDIPATASYRQPSKATTYEYVDRAITVTTQHVGEVGGQSFKGYIVNFGCGAPSISVVYNKLLTVGGNYSFKSVLNVLW